MALYTEKGLMPVIGAEIEFYCYGQEDIRQIGNYLVKKEKGYCQYEINIEPSDPIMAIANIEQCFKVLEDHSKKLDIHLSPKPFKNDYGNSLQLHVSFGDLFNDPQILSDCCDILCENMLDSFLIFAPTEECYTRFDGKFLTPTNVSKGFNNRTTALRIPPTGAKRIEYRIGSYPADPFLMVYIILDQLKEILIYRKKVNPQNFIYGNAYDEQYQLVKFPISLEEGVLFYKQAQASVE